MRKATATPTPRKLVKPPHRSIEPNANEKELKRMKKVVAGDLRLLCEQQHYSSEH